MGLRSLSGVSRFVHDVQHRFVYAALFVLGEVDDFAAAIERFDRLIFYIFRGHFTKIKLN